MKNYFFVDTHAHIGQEYFQNQIDLLVNNALTKKIKKILIPGTNSKDSQENILIAQKYNNIFVGIGIHPNNVKYDNFNFLDKINWQIVSFIGETGLDFFHKNHPPLTLQKDFFIKHLELACKYNLPIVIHIRNAFQEVYDILAEKQKYFNLKIILHSFTGTIIWAKKFLKFPNCYISFSGIVTFKNAQVIQEVAQKIPLNKILIETDSPFLTPVPLRGKKNQPQNLIYTFEYLSNLRVENKQEVAQVLWNNSHQAFNLKNQDEKF